MKIFSAINYTCTVFLAHYLSAFLLFPFLHVVYICLFVYTCVYVVRNF